MSETLEAGLLGVGNIGSIHLRSISVMDNVRVAAVADVDREMRDRAREITRCRTYSDYTDLLASENLDIVVNSLPPFLHAEATIQAAERGFHVFVEKPFARSVEEGEDMLNAAQKHGVKLAVDHTIRYQPEIQKMKRIYDHGKLGHVPLCYISRVNNGPFSKPPEREPVANWQLDPEMTGGGVVFRLGVHLLDVLEWFFGEMTIEYAHLGSQFNGPIEDTALIVLRSTESDTMAILACGTFQWESLPDVNMLFRLEGTTGYLEDQSFVPDSLELHAAKSMVKNMVRRGFAKDLNYYEPTYYYQAHFRALIDFVESVAEDKQPPVSGEDGLRTIELAEKTYAFSGKTYGI